MCQATIVASHHEASASFNETRRKWLKVSARQQVCLVASFLLAMKALATPAIGVPLTALLSNLLGNKYKDYPTQVLSTLNWVIHVFMVMIGREFTTTLRQPYNSHRLRSFGLLFLLGELSGFLFLMHHCLIACEASYADQLAMQLLILGDYIVKVQAFVTGIVLMAPNAGLFVCTPVVLVLVHLDLLTFTNVYGNLLSTFSLVCVLATPSLHAIFKIAYVGASLIPALGIDTSTDKGHFWTALLLDCLVAAMVVGLKLKDVIVANQKVAKIM